MLECKDSASLFQYRGSPRYIEVLPDVIKTLPSNKPFVPT